MKILIVGMLDSVHLAKWVSLIDSAKHKIILFPSSKYILNEKLKTCDIKVAYPGSGIRFISYLFGDAFACNAARFLERIVRFVSGNRLAGKEKILAGIIRREKPNVIHSMETQKAGYLVLAVKEKYFRDKKFPLWLHTNWGSDIYLFGRLKEHKDKIRRVMTECDFYSCESQRDIQLVKQFGYIGPFFEPFPNACGFNMNEIQKMNNKTRTSDRKMVLVKGYQGWAGRALTALRSIRLSAEYLADYKIILYSVENGGSVEIESELIGEETSLSIEVINNEISNNMMLELFATARLYLGVGISDGISTSMLEAMAMGAFPIQSNTSSADEWIVDGETGFIVSPDDPEGIAERIRRAITDDALVDSAAEKNLEVIKERADSNKIKIQIDQMYQTIAYSHETKA